MPSDFSQDYDLSYISNNGKVLAEIRKGIHALQQVGKIANDNLKQHLLPYVHVPTKHTPRLWRHMTFNVTFTLIVDNFGIKHTNIEQVKRLLHFLQQIHNITVD